MKKIFSFFLFISLLIIISFLLFSNFENYIENTLGKENSLFMYSILSFLFLTSDIILPVPSSLLMILNGKVLGIIGGTILSTLSGQISSLIGFFIGKKSNKYLNKFFKETEITASNKFFNKFGPLSIVISKPIPIISESVSIISGTTDISLKTFLLLSLLGWFVTSLTLSIVGNFG